MKREALIIVPKQDNNGKSLADLTKAVALVLCEHFGGCTAVDAQGYWDGGPKLGLIAEPVTQLIVAYEPSHNQDVVLRQIAKNMGHDAEQWAVYVRYASGDVEVINLV